MSVADRLFHWQPSSLVPLYHWRGVPPPVLDLHPEQVGWLVCLLFAREGDCCLLPLAWYSEQPDPWRDVPWHEPQPLAAGTVERGLVHTLQTMLLGDGWQLRGRMVLDFTGYEAVTNFGEQIDVVLGPHGEEEP